MKMGSTLIPCLKVKNFDDLDVRDYKLIRDEYNGKVLPFFKEINDLLSGKSEINKQQ